MTKMKNWRARIEMLRHLTEAKNHATALGLDGEAVDLRILVDRLIRKWDDEFIEEEAKDA